MQLILEDDLFRYGKGTAEGAYVNSFIWVT